MNIDSVRSWVRSKANQFKDWNAERKDRCTLDRIYYDYDQECWIRYRDKRSKRSELPSCAVPVTRMRNTYAIVSADPPEPAPYGQNAITLFVWSEDFSFEKSFEHFSDDGVPIDWKKVLIVAGVVILGIYAILVFGGVI